MYFSFSYNKKQVLQGLRYHFISQKEIRLLLIIIIIFDIISAIFYFIGKIRPEPFLLGSFIWFLFIISFWFLMPNAVYRRSVTFKDKFVINFQPAYIALENEKGRVEWQWNLFTKYFESPNFFHLYFSTKSFFLVPKNGLDADLQNQIRTILNTHIQMKSS